jgi:archaemetzincin
MNAVTTRFFGLTFLTVLGGLAWVSCAERKSSPRNVNEDTYADVERNLRPLAKKLGESDWLRHHKEDGQTFAEYLAADPVRKSKRWNTIYLCLVGDFTKDQHRILELTREYMAIFFDAPVKIHKRVSLKSIPDRAKRVHSGTRDRQILSTYVLDEILKPNRPDNALAYLAFTASDLWPGEGWNFVFGQASLRDRTGVWSIHRNGDPSRSDRAFRRCLERTLGTATHETGHILTMQHCIAFECSMCGSNSQSEADLRPLHLCPVCLRKLCWNLRVQPIPYLKKLGEFCRTHGLKEEGLWYAKAIEALGNE